MRYVIFLFLILLAGALASGCRVVGSEVASPISPTTTGTSVAPLATATGIATETATVTATGIATATAVATGTSLPAATVPASATPFPSDPTPTLVATPVLAEMDLESWSETSPDGTWVAEGVVAYPQQSSDDAYLYYTRLSVFSADGATSWTLVDAWQPWGLGYTVPRPFQWSADQPFFYYTNEPVPDGCALFVNGSDLHRVDLRDGSVTTVLPPSGLWLALSPDEQRIAYRGYGERDLVIRDVDSGAETEIPLDLATPYALGHIVWAPDGSAVVVTVAHNPCAAGWAEATSLLRVDLPSKTVTTLLAADERRFVSAAWPTGAWVLLRDDADQAWWLDVENGAVEAAAEMRAPATADTPAAGICAAAPASLAVMTINPDVPDPRCLQVTPEQRLRLRNQTTETVRVQLGLFDVTLAPGATFTFDAPFGAYLAPGVHSVSGAPFGGGQLWLQGE